jgi:uncharacterized protein DUF6334
MDELVKILDRHEVLVDVVPFAHVDLPDKYAAIRLHFSSTVLCVAINPDDDSLYLSNAVPPETIQLRSVAEREPWINAVLRPMLWAWQLVNHQGYADGIQIAFYDPDSGMETAVIQLMGTASTIDVSSVHRIVP